jgi:hypothetical protein
MLKVCEMALSMDEETPEQVIGRMTRELEHVSEQSRVSHRMAVYWLSGSNREIFGGKVFYLTVQGVVSSLNKRPDTVGEPISILRPTCLHAMFQAPLGSKKP